MPIVSILLPTYKDAPHILQSVKSVLAQSFNDWELVVINDGLTELAKQNLLDFIKNDQRISIISNPSNFGIQKSLNAGLASARGEFIARIDDDDTWVDKDKLTNQVKYLQENPEYVLVGTNATICDANGNEIGAYSLPQDDVEIRSRMLIKNCFIHPSIMARKQAIRQSGGYDESENVKHIEDYALWLKLGLIGKFANIKSQSVRMIIHSNSLTFKNRLIQAKRMFSIVNIYKDKYPNFFLARLILFIRIIGFYLLRFIPIPNKLVYGIQMIYKKI
jgi:glycosyltransferase involved in cell wall biosynthesis